MSNDPHLGHAAFHPYGHGPVWPTNHGYPAGHAIRSIICNDEEFTAVCQFLARRRAGEAGRVIHDQPAPVHGDQAITDRGADRELMNTCTITWEDRISNYHSETGFPASLFLGGDGRCVGTWIMGNNYRVKSTYYGGYPAGYLKRIRALFPDKRNVLHLFSGRVDTATLPGKTVDINEDNDPDYVDDAQSLKNVPVESFDLVMADPPYSVEDCDHYKTTMIKRNVVMQTLGERMRPGAHVVWLDQVLPMYRKDQFKLEAVIGMVKSTNHRFRVITVFGKGHQ